MSFRLANFLFFFCLLFAGGTLLFGDATFNAGTALGAALCALLIAAIIKQPKK